VQGALTAASLGPAHVHARLLPTDG
jgi:hypothetical protein